MQNPGEETREPSSLQTALAEFIARQPPNSRLSNIGLEMLRAHHVNQERRAAVLAHDDLRRRLVRELGYARPEQWNGYVPPATVNPGSSEDFCRSAYIGRDGAIRFQFSQTGRRAIGEIPNDSRYRAVLLELSQEAWNRQQAKPEGESP